MSNDIEKFDFTEVEVEELLGFLPLYEYEL